MTPEVLILGGGFAGLAAADELTRRGRPRASVVLVDRRPHAVFAPLLPDLISGRIRPRHMTHPLWPHCRRLGVGFIQATVEKVMPSTCRIETDRGTLSADYLILALGCENNYFGNRRAEERTIGLKTVSEGLALRAQALEAIETVRDGPARRSRPHFVIVGGGYTGFEIASHLAHLVHSRTRLPYRDLSDVCDILIVELADEVLGNCSAGVRAWALGLAEDYGIRVRTGCTVETFREGAVTLSDGTDLAPAVCVWSAGVTPGPAAAPLDTPKTRGGRLVVDEFLRLPGHSRVFAAGDLAGPVLPGEDGPLRLAVQFSIAGGRCAARNVLRGMRGEQQQPFRAKDLGYVVPLAPGRAAGVVLGVEMVGRAPSLLHYAMCAARSWTWSDRVGVLVDLLRRGEAG